MPRPKWRGLFLLVVYWNSTLAQKLVSKEQRGATLMLRNTLVIFGLSILLVACGDSKLDRGLSGAAIGAGAGGAAWAVTGTSTLGGAVLGGAAGAATGVLTDEDDIDLGKPVWRR
jgi:osmotically inducible lipoprotein OsmB